MAKLPEPDWISLSECPGRVEQAFGVERHKVETALVEAFHEEKIRTRGRCRSYFEFADEYLQDLAGYTWDRVNVVWEENKFVILYYGAPLHIFSDVVVCREDLTKWINGAVSDSQRATHEPVESLTPEPPADEPRSQDARKKDRGARDVKIQRAAEQVWKSVWKKGKGVLLSREDIASRMLTNDDLLPLLRDLRSKHERRLSQDSVIRLISEPDWVRKARNRRKDN